MRRWNCILFKCHMCFDVDVLFLKFQIVYVFGLYVYSRFMDFRCLGNVSVFVGFVSYGNRGQPRFPTFPHKGTGGKSWGMVGNRGKCTNA